MRGFTRSVASIRGRKIGASRFTTDDPRIEKIPEVGCWLWLGALVHGYGRCAVGATLGYAHRQFYEAAKGAIPDGLVLDHICRTPECVNPDHLRAVTNTENVMEPRSQWTARRNRDKTECPKCQAPFTLRKDGNGRVCVPCNNEASRIRMNALYAKRRADGLLS